MGVGRGVSMTVLVIYIHVRWEICHRRFLYRALARLLKGKAVVLCVDRPLDPVASPILRPRRILRWLEDGPGPREESENLFLFTPWVFLHDQVVMGVKPVVWANRRFLTHQIDSALRRMSLDRGRRISWIAHPLLHNFLGVAGEELAIYECFDEYAAYPGLPKKRSAKLRCYERKVLEKVGLVFAVSERLVLSKGAVNPNIYFMPNAAEVEHFERALDGKTQIAPEAASIKHPIIGFIGGIWGIFHAELLQYVATSRPDWSLLLVGNLNKVAPPAFLESFKRLVSLGNVTWLGWRDYEILPGYLKPMDVCLLPYEVNEWTENCYPNKVHQYLAAGKAVVSTDLPEVRPFGDVVRIADSREEFLAMIEKGLKDYGPEAVARRRAVAAQNSWDERAKLAWGVIERHLAGKGSGEY
ncbi:MAG: glycosyltransferase [Chloroflexi bacterium]|nr:glycosyltransferase [Chloroflexota bacterium]